MKTTTHNSKTKNCFYNFLLFLMKLFKKNNKITNYNDVDTNLFKYIHMIRNLKKLDEQMIENICNMSNEYKMKIIITYNAVVEDYRILIMELIERVVEQDEIINASNPNQGELQSIQK